MSCVVYDYVLLSFENPIVEKMPGESYRTIGGKLQTPPSQDSSTFSKTGRKNHKMPMAFSTFRSTEKSGHAINKGHVPLSNCAECYFENSLPSSIYSLALVSAMGTS
jgi:hypothetical protein